MRQQSIEDHWLQVVSDYLWAVDVMDDEARARAWSSMAMTIALVTPHPCSWCEHRTRCSLAEADLRLYRAGCQ